MSSDPERTSRSGPDRASDGATARRVGLNLALTLGDPRGIGPELAPVAVRTFQASHPGVDVIAIGADGTRLDGLTLHGVGPFDGTEASAGRVSVDAIREGVRLATDGDVDALVTGPVSKPALHAAGHEVPGQTELLGSLTGAPVVGMLMAAERTRLGSPLRVLLATTHVALRAVPGRLTGPLLQAQVRLLDDALRRGWGLDAPRIGMCGLNPHASDGGLFGDEEDRVMAPALTRLRADGVDISDPLPADTVFVRALDGAFDAVVAPYHDVGMAPFKTVAFGHGVNVTLGLPLVRTSPDHGTAFDIAGRGIADPSSTVAALALAYRLASAEARS